MKKYLLWSFERGSRPYDAICAVILAFIFLTPARFFHDRPDYMRVVSQEPVRRTADNIGKLVYTVQVPAPGFVAALAAEKAAVDRLQDAIHEKFIVSRSVPIYDTIGRLIAFAIWIERGVQGS